MPDRLLGIVEDAKPGGSDGGLEHRPHGRRDHPCDDGTRPQQPNDLGIASGPTWPVVNVPAETAPPYALSAMLGVP